MKHSLFKNLEILLLLILDLFDKLVFIINFHKAIFPLQKPSILLVMNTLHFCFPLLITSFGKSNFPFNKGEKGLCKLRKAFELYQVYMS